jgi:hypothetical protein
VETYSRDGKLWTWITAPSANIIAMGPADVTTRHSAVVSDFLYTKVDYLKKISCCLAHNTDRQILQPPLPTFPSPQLAAGSRSDSAVLAC